MSPVVDRVVDEVLELPADARMNLVDRILMSLNLPTQPDVDRLWADEAEKRVASLDSGMAELVSGEVVFDKIRRKYAS